MRKFKTDVFKMSKVTQIQSTPETSMPEASQVDTKFEINFYVKNDLIPCHPFLFEFKV